VLNKAGAPAGVGFDARDQARFAELADRLGPILESWQKLASRGRMGAGDDRAE
jgi:hypothetical protein